MVIIETFDPADLVITWNFRGPAWSVPHFCLPLALIEPTTQTGHRLPPVCPLHHLIDRRAIVGGHYHRAGVQPLNEICQVTSLSLATDQDKRHRCTPRA